MLYLYVSMAEAWKLEDFPGNLAKLQNVDPFPEISINFLRRFSKIYQNNCKFSRFMGLGADFLNVVEIIVKLFMICCFVILNEKYFSIANSDITSWIQNTLYSHKIGVYRHPLQMTQNFATSRHDPLTQEPLKGYFGLDFRNSLQRRILNRNISQMLKFHSLDFCVFS